MCMKSLLYLVCHLWPLCVTGVLFMFWTLCVVYDLHNACFVCGSCGVYDLCHCGVDYFVPFLFSSHEGILLFCFLLCLCFRMHSPYSHSQAVSYCEAWALLLSRWKCHGLCPQLCTSLCFQLIDTDCLKRMSIIPAVCYDFTMPVLKYPECETIISYCSLKAWRVLSFLYSVLLSDMFDIW